MRNSADRRLFPFVALVLSVASGAINPARAQEASDLRIFGFFQNSFIHQTEYATEFDRQSKRNSFSVQQHNLFFQKDLDVRWRAFVNYEFLNTFSSSRRWGSANLEEVWVRYRRDAQLNLKLGLSIPVFNNLNEIKNRTPLLPYIVRPLVYETSFSEFIAVEEYLPARAFAQAYGFVPVNELKVDYAVFLGNGPNINSDSQIGQTGVDTTDSYLVGGRIGLRNGDGKIGLSATRDHINGESSDLVTIDLEQLTRRRLGADVSYAWRSATFEAEIIDVAYDDDSPLYSFDKRFWYATLAVRATDRLLLYGSYYETDEHDVHMVVEDTISSVHSKVKVPTVGASYQLRPSVMLKAQYAPVDIEASADNLEADNNFDFHHLSAAVSVIF